MRVKGMKDILPPDMDKFRKIEEVFVRKCRAWGYEEIRTPTIEYLYLFTSAGTLTPSMLSSVYSFLDWDGWSGERVVLRPDGTIPAARLFIENKKPRRLFYVENTFSFLGDERERWQFGAELIGEGEDIEILSLFTEILRALGIEPFLRISHMGILKSYLGEGLEEFLEGKREVPDIKGKRGFLKNLKAILSVEDEKPFTELDEILKFLEEQNISYEVDISMRAGFEYYTGFMFQAFYEGKRLGGGGRYDELIPLLGGGNFPACGFALYFDSLKEFIRPDGRKIRVKVHDKSFRKLLPLIREMEGRGYGIIYSEEADIEVFPDSFLVGSEKIDNVEEVIKFLGL